MAKASDALGILRQNLIDAGCSRELIKQCIALVQENKPKEFLPLLSRHRRSLLDSIHQWEKQLDCLDYLIYQLEKEQK